MSKFVAALRQTLVGAYTEPPVHFHSGSTDESPEVCYDGACRRPQLSV